MNAISSTARLVLVGDANVGKTSIIQQYQTGQFDVEGEPTIGASFIAEVIQTETGPLEVQIWDTAGQERYRSLIPMYTRNAAACIFVVDLTNRVSFDHLEMWLSLAQANCSDHCCIYVVGNKSDLEPIVRIGELENWSANRGYPCFATSAHNHESVRAVFERVTADLTKRKVLQAEVVPALGEPPKQSRCCWWN
jgi:small GTP-binding protein